jgi:hypothetical protein
MRHSVVGVHAIDQGALQMPVSLLQSRIQPLSRTVKDPDSRVFCRILRQYFPAAIRGVIINGNKLPKRIGLLVDGIQALRQVACRVFYGHDNADKWSLTVHHYL